MAAPLLTSLPAVVFSAFVVSFATVVVPGPITFAASRYAVSHGTRAAAVLLTAVTLTDVGVFSLIVFGFQPIMHRVGGARILIPVAGVLLIVAGAAMVFVARRDTERLVSRRAQRRVEREEAVHGPFAAGVAVAVLNPGYWIWWTTAGTAFIHAARHWGKLGLGLLLVAFITGVMAWFVPLLWALHHGRRLFPPVAHERILIGLGIAMAGFGTYLLWGALR
jgi:threonine/homoserine/homoserine lactone efflux protein